MLRDLRPTAFHCLLIFTIAFLGGCNSEAATEVSSFPDPFSPATPISTQTSTVTPSPAWTPSPTVTLAPDQLGTRVTFQAEDGHGLVGYFYPSWKPSAPVVILMHEYGNNQVGWQESAIIPWMQNWGALDTTDQQYIYAGGRLPQMPKDLSFAVFTFDFRGHGESLPAPDQISLEQNAAGFLMDARAAFTVARTLPGVDPNHLIGIGASIGADAVVDACGEGCSGAFSVSPGNWLKIDYGNAVQALIAQRKPVRCMYANIDDPSPQTCWSVMPNELYRIFSYTGIKHGMTFFVPRKMEAGFGTNLLEFLIAASR